MKIWVVWNPYVGKADVDDLVDKIFVNEKQAEEYVKLVDDEEFPLSISEGEVQGFEAEIYDDYSTVEGTRGVLPMEKDK